MVKRAEEWFPLYPSHYHRDTTELTTEQHGAYPVSYTHLTLPTILRV